MAFSYVNEGGNDCYLYFGGTWYSVSNPSDPPVNYLEKPVETETVVGVSLEAAASHDVFGRLFPKEIMEGYIVDGNVSIYNESIMLAQFDNTPLQDEMVIRIASKEWFYNQNADLKFNTIFYQEKTSGTGSYVYVDGGDYVVQYAFSNTDVGSIIDIDRNKSFLNMVNSAEQFGDFILFDRCLYDKNDLSQETLEGLDWYNSMSPEDQIATSYIPTELLDPNRGDDIKVLETDEAE